MSCIKHPSCLHTLYTLSVVAAIVSSGSLSLGYSDAVHGIMLAICRLLPYQQMTRPIITRGGLLLGCCILQVVVEERMLLERYGRLYEEYKAKVKKFFPFVY